jgi:hypothetical protein
MPGKLILMSPKELERLALMQRIAERRTTQALVAEQLGVSLRQVERLHAAYKAHGADGLVSRKRGVPSNRQLQPELRALALELVRTRYADFGPTLAHEKLVEAHGLSVSLSTVRKWLVEGGVWTRRRERKARVYQPRPRRSCLGELVQVDGCQHHWFEGRGPECTALVYVDDATGRLMELRFVRSESTFDYFAATRCYLERHGKPVAFYSDKASTFRVNAKDPKAGDGYTQFGRAMSDLNIDILCANSAQAKGRVERAHQTLQDRLVKELRLRDISTMDDANAYAPDFMEDYNGRFAREPKSTHDAHRPLLAHEDLDRLFRWQEERRVTQNLTLHYKRVMYLLEPNERARAAAGNRVMVSETHDGSVVIEYQGTTLPACAFEKDRRVSQGAIADNKVLGPLLADIQRRQQERDAHTLATKRLTLREEDLMRKVMGEPGLLTRRADARRPAPEQQAPPVDKQPAPPARGGVVDQLIAQTVSRLNASKAPTPNARPKPRAAKTVDRQAAHSHREWSVHRSIHVVETTLMPAMTHASTQIVIREFGPTRCAPAQAAGAQ